MGLCHVTSWFMSCIIPGAIPPEGGNKQKHADFLCKHMGGILISQGTSMSRWKLATYVVLIKKKNMLN